MWVNLVTRKYLKGESLYNYKVKSNVSWQWCKLMNLRTSFEKGIIWSVGGGLSIYFWFGNWVYDHPLADRCHVQDGSN